MSGSLDLSVAKKNLSEALGDGIKLYLQILGSWFKRKITREDFDHEARKMLPTDSVHLHNQFLLAILTKCQSLEASLGNRESKEPALRPTTTSSSPTKGPRSKAGSSRVRRKPQSTRPNFQQRFVPVNPLQQALPVNLPEPEQDKRLAFASGEMTLPDIGMVHGRMIVTAWDYGLDSVDDNAVRIMMNAIEGALKNIITVVLARRNAYRLREGKFRYALGAPVPQTFLRNTQHLPDSTDHSEATSISMRGVHMPALKTSVEMGNRDAAMWLASSGHVPPTKAPISLWDLLDALQVHRSAIPSHTVYASNMERIINKLWHPSNDELAQEELHRQEMHIKQDMAINALTLRT